MKKYILILSAFVVLIGLAACSDKDDAKVQNSLSTESIVTYAHRSVNPVQVYAEESWVATTDVPWIQISPANGLRSAECKVIVDSTVVQHARDARVRFTFASGETRFLQVEQSGYLPTIELKDTLVNLENYANADERYFDIQINTNVRFNVNISNVVEGGSTSWIRHDAIDFNFDRGARPRNMTVRFRWQNNNIPSVDRRVNIKFDPIDATDYPYERLDSLLVIQKPGMLIEDSRAGDSLAILAINRGLNSWYLPDASEMLHNWDGVEVWQAAEVGSDREKIGRVKKAEFVFFSTTEGIPYEVRYLKHVEALSFFSNGNSDEFSLTLGENLSELKDNLKSLTVFAYGFSELHESFKELVNLEYLDLSNNTFERVPEMINKFNFPNLKELHFTTMNLKGHMTNDYIRCCTWDNLETLRFSRSEARRVGKE